MEIVCQEIVAKLREQADVKIVMTMGVHCQGRDFMRRTMSELAECETTFVGLSITRDKAVERIAGKQDSIFAYIGFDKRSALKDCQHKITMKSGMDGSMNSTRCCWLRRL